MKKAVKRGANLVAMVLTVLLVLSMLAGCGAAKTDEETNTTGAVATEAASTAPTAVDPFKDNMEISIALWDIGNGFPEGANDPVRDIIYKKLNITIKPVNVTWDDYVQKIQVWAASSQLPDLFAIDAIGSPNFKNWITQGIVHELPADLSPYPVLAKMMEGPDFQAYKYPLAAPDAKYFCVPRPNYRDSNTWANDWGIMLRKDWMQNVGITKMPENMDEFTALMKAFVEKDPDKNGKNDTIGLTCYNASWLSYLMLGYEPGISTGQSYWIRNNGKWLPAFMTDKCVAGIKAIKQLYDAGGLDKDFATLKAEEGDDKFSSGIAGAYAWNGIPFSLHHVAQKFAKVFPDKRFEDCVALVPPFKNSDGNYYRTIAVGPWSESYINAKADDNKVDRILRMLDYFLSDEGTNLLGYGVEGVDYTKQGDDIVMIDQKDADGKPVNITAKYPILQGLGSIVDWGGDRSYKTPTVAAPLRKISQDMLDWDLNNAKPIDTDLRLGFLDYTSKAKAVENFSEDLVKAVMSKDAEKAWKDMIANYLANGYDKVIEEFNAKTTELGIK